MSATSSSRPAAWRRGTAPRGGRAREPQRPPRRGLRLPRPERRRQDDHAAHAARTDPADERVDNRPGRRPGDPASLATIGSMIEGPAFYPFLSGRDNLEVVARYAGVGKAHLDQVARDGRSRLTRRRQVPAYSLGMKQRLGVAAALLKQPDLIVLDEPTNGLDPAGMRDMRALIRQLGDAGRTVILSSHMIGEVQQVCDRVGVIRLRPDGRWRARSRSSAAKRAGPPCDALRRRRSEPRQVRYIQGRPHRRRGAAAPGRRTPHRRRGPARSCWPGVEVREVRRVDRQLEDVFFEITTKETFNEATKEASHV